MVHGEAPRVLLVTLKRWWIGVSRLPMALREAGFEVAAWCPVDSYVARSGAVSRHYPWIGLADWSGELRRIVAEWKPELLVPADETMAAFLRRLSRRSRWLIPSGRDFNALLSRSLGDVRRSAGLGSKIHLQSLARSLGLRTPDDRAVPDVGAAMQCARELGYPVVLKDEAGAGGSGVKVCSDDAALRTAWADLDSARPKQ